MSDLVKIPASRYKPSSNPASFGIMGAAGIVWETCRDRFQTASETVEFFLIYHPEKAAENIIEFMRTVEEAARVAEKDKLIFRKTTEGQVLHITMSSWWKYRVRRSLLTALLRCGPFYTNHNGAGFVKALNSQAYTKGTWEAVSRFLSGYTACKMKKSASFGGWQNLFQSRKPETVLVKLKRCKDSQ